MRASNLYMQRASIKSAIKLAEKKITPAIKARRATKLSALFAGFCTRRIRVPQQRIYDASTSDFPVRETTIELAGKKKIHRTQKNREKCSLCRPR